MGRGKFAVGSGEGSLVAGLQEFPRSPDSAEKKRKLAQTFLKSLIWRVKKGDGTRKEESRLGLNRRSSGQLRVLSRSRRFVYFASTVSLVCSFAIRSRRVSMRCPVSRMASTWG